MKGELADLFAPKNIDPNHIDPKTGEKLPAKPSIKVMIGSTASIGEGLKKLNPFGK